MRGEVSKPGSEPREFTQVELEDDGWVYTAEPVGPNCPFGHPWGANERIAKLEGALRRLGGMTHGEDTMRIIREALGE